MLLGCVSVVGLVSFKNTEGLIGRQCVATILMALIETPVQRGRSAVNYGAATSTIFSKLLTVRPSEYVD